MNVFIDESGTFAPAQNAGSWCVVAAAVAPETARRHIDAAISELRVGRATTEVKLRELTESQYADFLDALFASGVVLFGVATDSFFNRKSLIEGHRSHLVANIRDNINRMKFEGGRHALAALATQLESLSDQLYVQMICQVKLVHTITSRSISYFSQIQPPTLREIRWRIDQKNNKKPTFEKTFEQIAPALLQTYSFEEPMLMVRGFDYSHMTQYEFGKKEYPTYLQEDYDLPPVDGFNLQKLLRKNLKFEDSKKSSGVQAADLLASGMRRCLRGKYKLNSDLYRRLARLTLQNEKGRHPIELLSFATSASVDPVAAATVKAMFVYSRPYLRQHPSPRRAQ